MTASSSPHPALTLLASGPADTHDPRLLAAAEAALTPTEREALARHAFPKRRADWLLGRLAAKSAVAAAWGRPEALSDVAIESLPSGAPAFSLPDGALADWRVSLTHGHGRAAAFAAPGPVGVDLEALREVPERGWRFFLTEPERRRVAAGELGPHGEVVAWALKEAAYKVLEGAVTGVLSLELGPVRLGRAAVIWAEGAIACRYDVGSGFCLAIAARADDAAWLEAVRLAAP